jgi:hypothetical protein
MKYKHSVDFPMRSDGSLDDKATDPHVEMIHEKKENAIRGWSSWIWSLIDLMEVTLRVVQCRHLPLENSK